MIAFGSSVHSAEAYARYAEPGIRRTAEPDSEVLAFAAVDTTGRTYNLILDAAARLDDLEALVLLDPHAEIDDPGFLVKVRAALADSEVALVGCAGATGARGIAWWEGAVVAAPGAHQYNEFGSGELQSFPWVLSRAAPPAAVQTLDGELLVLSPWAVRNLRFDESLRYSYGYDLDICLQAGAAERKVMVADLRVVFHRSLELVKNLDIWVESHVRVAEKWDSALNPTPDDEHAWRRRARYAEADREAARAFAFSRSLTLDARVLQLEREFDVKTHSFSWKLTAPLRAANQIRRRLLGREI